MDPHGCCLLTAGRWLCTVCACVHNKARFTGQIAGICCELDSRQIEGSQHAHFIKYHYPDSILQYHINLFSLKLKRDIQPFVYCCEGMRCSRSIMCILVCNMYSTVICLYSLINWKLLRRLSHCDLCEFLMKILFKISVLIHKHNRLNAKLQRLFKAIKETTQTHCSRGER